MENKEEIYKAMRGRISQWKNKEYVSKWISTRKELYETLLDRRLRCITQLAAIHYTGGGSECYERRKEIAEEQADVERSIINFGWEAVGAVSWMCELWNPIDSSEEK